MAEIGRWSGHKFEVSPALIHSFNSLQITGSCETEEKESSGDKYVARKNGKPTEVSFSVELNTFVGCDVRSDALQFVADAKAGKKGYFYVGKKKLVPYRLMLVQANVNETELAPSGKWVSAKVQLTMKQCVKNADSSKASANTATTTSTVPHTTGVTNGNEEDMPIYGIDNKMDLIKARQDRIRDITTTAKIATGAMKGGVTGLAVMTKIAQSK